MQHNPHLTPMSVVQIFPFTLTLCKLYSLINGTRLIFASLLPSSEQMWNIRSVAPIMVTNMHCALCVI